MVVLLNIEFCISRFGQIGQSTHGKSLSLAIFKLRERRLNGLRNAFWDSAIGTWKRLDIDFIISVYAVVHAWSYKEFVFTLIYTSFDITCRSQICKLY